MELLRELCRTPGIPGREERVRAIVRREFSPLTDELRVDGLGNVIGLRRGAGGKKLLLAAHMDEIGFLVTHIEPAGLLRLHPVGGHDPRNMVAQRALVMGKRDLAGVLYPGQRPPHLRTPDDANKTPLAAEFFVDLGMPAEEVRELVSVGTPVVIHRELEEIGQCVTGKALDNRVSVYVLIEALRRVSRCEWDVYAVATVQEEVGVRGVSPAAFGVQPDVALALDVTIAGDLPGLPEHEQVTRLGAGVAIKVMDGDSISSPLVVAALRELAEQRGILYQLEILPRGGTDAAGIQRIRSGVPVCTVSIPTRYVHTSIETCHRNDLEAAITLVTAFLEEGHRFSFLPE